MPKFSLYEGADTPNGEQRVRCEIGWMKGYDVQIAVTRLAPGLEPANDETSFDEGPPVNTTITIAGGAVIAGATTHASGPPSEFAWQGQHMRLTRPQINTLIRTLRDARDAAYGRDE